MSGDELRRHIEAELELLPPESEMTPFFMGAGAAYNHVLSCLAPDPPTTAADLAEPSRDAGLRTALQAWLDERIGSHEAEDALIVVAREWLDGQS